jgi:hypothetical protein
MTGINPPNSIGWRIKNPGSGGLFRAVASPVATLPRMTCQDHVLLWKRGYPGSHMLTKNTASAEGVKGYVVSVKPFGPNPIAGNNKPL